jgi:hypothetical protein
VRQSFDTLILYHNLVKNQYFISNFYIFLLTLYFNIDFSG